MRSDGVKALARKYYNCPNADGVSLENGGGGGTAGSHWERSEVGDEAMTGADINEPKYSKFTLTLLKDTGWYNPDMSMADELLWGKGEGCDFITQKCKSGKRFKDFCYTSGSSSCDEDGSIKTYCASDKYSDGCKYWKDYGNGVVEEHGKKCFTIFKGSTERGKTLKYHC